MWIITQKTGAVCAGEGRTVTDGMDTHISTVHHLRDGAKYEMPVRWNGYCSLHAL